jgi:hypothetical protein
MKPVPEKLDIHGHSAIPSTLIPSFRTAFAIQQGIEKNIMMVTWGGLGDQICAEPTIRFALDTFKGCKISLASEHPELFGHLNFHSVFDLKEMQPIWENYFPFQTIRPPTDLSWEFMSHMITNCVDYPSLCALRCQLPISYKQPILEPKSSHYGAIINIMERQMIFEGQPTIAVHAGRHWQSKTFPKTWWDVVLKEIIELGIRPILIGGDTDDNRGTVNVETSGCVDLRNELSIMESVALLKYVNVLLTNDSAPLHMAATGEAWIGFVATCKHPDYISHWRNGQWSWRMENHSLGGIWDVLDYCPNAPEAISAENVGDHLEKWLPNPVLFARWGVEKARSCH